LEDFIKVLTSKKKQWNEVLLQRRKEYRDWMKDLFPESLREIEDTPESYEILFDENLINDINKDIKRTYDQIMPEEIENIVINNIHSKRIRRILILWAKLHPNINYVQGMNDVLRPIYYLFATDEDEISSIHAECDSFFCFTNLMIEIIYNFCENLDNSEIGIFSKMNELDEMLKMKDIDLWNNLESKNLKPQLYSFRWISLLFSQDFSIKIVLRIWDSLLSDENRFEFLKYICVGLLINIRKQLLEGDLSDNLSLLHNYPTFNTEELLDLAIEIKDSKYDFQKTILVQQINQFTF